MNDCYAVLLNVCFINLMTGQEGIGLYPHQSQTSSGDSGEITRFEFISIIELRGINSTVLPNLCVYSL